MVTCPETFSGDRQWPMNSDIQSTSYEFLREHWQEHGPSWRRRVRQSSARRRWETAPQPITQEGMAPPGHAGVAVLHPADRTTQDTAAHA